MANKSLLVSILFLLLAIPIVSASGIIVTFDIISSETMTTTIIQPTNITYIVPSGTFNDFTFSATSLNDSTFLIIGYVDGIQEYANLSYVNNSIITFTQNVTFGTHNFTVYAEDSITHSSSTIIFTKQNSVSPMWFSALIPMLMSAGGLLFLVKMFIGSPKNGRELVEYTLASVIIFFLLIAGIVIIMGLIWVRN